MLAFAPDTQQLLDATFSDAGAWVSAVLTETIELRFDRLMSNQTISATLRLRISPAAPFGRDLTTRAQARWGGGTSFSNRARLVVGEASDATALAPLAITPPSGTPATTVDVAYDGFASNESVSLWYHLPDSSAVGLGTVRADAQGCIVYRLTATTLGAGRYNVVAYGQYSGISATGTVVLAAQLGGL